MEHKKPELIYETITRETVIKILDKPQGLESIPYDEEAFNLTDIGRRRRELVTLYDVYDDMPMHPNVLRYWARLGLKKELFDADRDDGKYAYSVFTPIDMYPDKKYALIYYSHGGGESIGMAETNGFNTIAGVEKYIVVYAQNGGRSNEEVDTEFGRIMGEIRKMGYPVDWERVYAAGFGSGGSASVCAACTYPDMVAAVAVMPGGDPFKELLFCSGPEYYASTKGYRIPGIFIGGTVDKGNFPAPWITEYAGSELGAGSVDDAMENLNIWMREIAKVDHFTPLTVQAVNDRLLHSADPYEKEFGLKFNQAYAFRAQGTDWLGGDFFGADGTPVMRFVRAEGVPHRMMTYSMMFRGNGSRCKHHYISAAWESQANIVWDYLKRFRRDLKTGESLYDPVVCWGER